MDLQSKQNQVDNQISLISESRNMGMVLSAKPRLKWTRELHQHFVDAVSQLGGAEKATPKTVMQVMGVPGLTLFHLKSHLQKYRIAQIEQSETSSGNEKEDFTVANYGNTKIGSVHINGENISQTHKQITESVQIARALQMQLYMQKKLHKQIEGHLQLRIESQGKYLQSILKKAQETFSGHNSPAMGLDNTKAKLLELISTVDTECPNSSVSRLTEEEIKRLLDSSLIIHQPQLTDCSIDSCLTSSESSERLQKLHMGPSNYWLNETQLLNQVTGAKRKFRTMSDETSVEQPTSKRSPHQEKPDNQSWKSALWEELDLNS